MIGDLFEQSIQILELPKVLERLSACAVTPEGKERTKALRPMTNWEEIQRAQEETAAAVSLLLQQGSPGITPVQPIGASLQRADMGGSLNTKELLEIAGVLEATRRMQEYGAGGETILSPLFDGLLPNRPLEEQITHSIVGEDELADSASSELASIRRQIRGAEGRVREILQRLISSDQAKYLQEALITIRSDRYVVPVRSEYKQAVPGLVHDVSASGSTFFVEPMSVVQVNNQRRTLLAQEKQEIDRILAQLSSACSQWREELEENYSRLIWLDQIFARGQLALKMEGNQPRLSQKGMRLEGVRHPLLDPKKAVANTLELGDTFDTLMITGPNTGGKTVTLKTFGLIGLMAQCGLHIPAKDGSYLPVFQQILADIGDEQSIDQSLSTFSAHMGHIIPMLHQAGEHTLILLDELGAGTDPIEGAALATAMIEHLRRMGAWVVATTHYAELKLYAMTTSGVENASCEFHVETLAPTYRLLLGIPGKSNAFAISRRLGLPEEMIQEATARLKGDQIRFEDVLVQLEKQRQGMEEDRAKLEIWKGELEEQLRKAQEDGQRLERERGRILNQAREEAKALLQEARETSELVISEWKEMQKAQSQENWQTVNQRRAESRRLLHQAEGKLGEMGTSDPEPGMTRAAVVGDTVELLTMGTKATVVAVLKDGSLQLQAGILKLSAKASEVRVIEGGGTPKETKRKQRAKGDVRLRMAVPSQVDLRGLLSEEALLVLERYLDTAMMGKLETVTVVHGKGTGALRQAVRSYLRGSCYVKGFRPGQYGEGEDGVTVVELK